MRSAPPPNTSWNWLSEFDPLSTREMDFHHAGGPDSQVEYLRKFDTQLSYLNGALRVHPQAVGDGAFGGAAQALIVLHQLDTGPVAPKSSTTPANSEEVNKALSVFGLELLKKSRDANAEPAMNSDMDHVPFSFRSLTMPGSDSWAEKTWAS